MKITGWTVTAGIGSATPSLSLRGPRHGPHGIHTMMGDPCPHDHSPGARTARADPAWPRVTGWAPAQGPDVCTLFPHRRRPPPPHRSTIGRARPPSGDPKGSWAGDHGRWITGDGPAAATRAATAARQAGVPRIPIGKRGRWCPPLSGTRTQRHPGCRPHGIMGGDHAIVIMTGDHSRGRGVIPGARVGRPGSRRGPQGRCGGRGWHRCQGDCHGVGGLMRMSAMPPDR